MPDHLMAMMCGSGFLQNRLLEQNEVCTLSTLAEFDAP